MHTQKARQTVNFCFSFLKLFATVSTSSPSLPTSLYALLFRCSQLIGCRTFRCREKGLMSVPLVDACVCCLWFFVYIFFVWFFFDSLLVFISTEMYIRMPHALAFSDSLCVRVESIQKSCVLCCVLCSVLCCVCVCVQATTPLYDSTYLLM